MGKTGYADLPLHHGRVPPWLAERMASLGRAISISIVEDYGTSEFLKRLSDPLWFQSFGAVLGMDWHSSGITTSVMGALKKSLNPVSRDLGIYVCGGRGRHSRKTPQELISIGDATGLDGQALARSSRLSAKIDNTAIQDGFQIYLHNFVVSQEGEWAVVQQGMDQSSGYARRYHWHSAQFESFVKDPHTGVCGNNQGLILNMVHHQAESTQRGTLTIAKEHPKHSMKEIKSIVMPSHHEVKVKDIDLKRLGAVLTTAYESEITDFETMLLLKGMGPRTLQSLVLVSEVIHGTPSRFTDPARFSFAHGGKDGHPFPVPMKVYDEVIDFMDNRLLKAKIDRSEKQKAFKRLHTMAKLAEESFQPDPRKYDNWVENERRNATNYGGRTVFDDFPSRPKTSHKKPGDQLSLF